MLLARVPSVRQTLLWIVNSETRTRPEECGGANHVNRCHVHPKTIPTAVRVQVLKATATLKGRSRAECISHMKALSIGAVVAFRPGEIGDETESEDEEDEDDTDADDGSASGLLFWLGVVVKTFTIAEEDVEVGTTDVQKGNPYMVVQWLEVDTEKDDGMHLCYKLHDVQDCITGTRIEGILPIKKLGSVRYVEGCKKDVFYNLIVALKTQIIALVALGNNK